MPRINAQSPDGRTLPGGRASSGARPTAVSPASSKPDTTLARYQMLARRTRDFFLFLRRSDLKIVEVNDAAIAGYGYRKSELLEMTFVDLYASATDADHANALATMDATGSVFFETNHQRKNGKSFPVDVSAQTAMLGDEEIVLAVVRDVSERKSAESRLEYLAQCDSLTGLANRASTVEKLQHAVADARRRGSMCGVLFLDIDRFKNVNDTLGHNEGDKLLTLVAERLRQNTQRTDQIGRLGGDEFVIVTTDVYRTDDVASVARKILDALERPFAIGDHELRVTASIGISAYPVDAENGETLIRNAHTAMYQAKGTGRNNFQFFTPDMRERIMRRLGLENELRLALQREDFYLEYQPVINMTSGIIVGAETLLRWKHPLTGEYSPDEFVPLAEDTGLIVPIGAWVLESACKQSNVWQLAGCSPLRITVNVSARQLLEPDFLAEVASFLRAAHMRPSSLELELTETALMADVERAASVLYQLRGMGVRISIDDFGTGYSSLGYVKRLPIDILKIDRSFIRELDVDPASQAITAAIITLAHSLKVRVIAEGVETAAQYRVLRRLSCDEMQGYFFSAPVSANDFRHLFKRGFVDIVSRAR